MARWSWSLSKTTISGAMFTFWPKQCLESIGYQMEGLFLLQKHPSISNSKIGWNIQTGRMNTFKWQIYMITMSHIIIRKYPYRYYRVVLDLRNVFWSLILVNLKWWMGPIFAIFRKTFEDFFCIKIQNHFLITIWVFLVDACSVAKTGSQHPFSDRLSMSENMTGHNPF